MTDVAVIIVTWNVRDLVLDALETLYADLAQSGLSYQVILVDNASHDGTAAAVREQFPQTTVIASDENHGFAGGNNLGMRHLGFDDESTAPESLPRAVYLLNPDTRTRPGATRHLYDALFSAPDVGLVGAQLFYEDGSFQHGAFGFPGLRQLWVEFFPVPGRFIEGSFNGRYDRERFRRGVPFEVDFTLGATMMLRREVIQQTGMFDESFFMYCEEIDWTWRIQQAGWRALTVPQAEVVHLAGKSTSQMPARSMVNLWESRLKLFRRYYPPWKLTLAKQIIIQGMRRKQAQLAQDTGLSDQERSDLQTACQTIIRLAQETT